MKSTETLSVKSASPRAGLEGFSLVEWGLLAGIALMWGSSFLFIEEGLRAFAPGLITLLRVLFGVLTLMWFERARSPIDLADWRRIALLAFFWMAAPFILFPLAQQWIDSSLAGMINGGVPVFAAVFAALAARRAPAGRQIVGIALGFVGVVLVSWPAVQHAESTALGAALVLAATVSYGIAINLAVPLQQKYGSLPVMLRAQAVAIVLVLIPGVMAIPESTFSWTSLGAMVPLGCLGTGVAFVAMGTLVGRVGAPRASLAVYFIPVVAIVLGAVVLSEAIAGISLIGTAMVIAGAVLASRG